MKTAADRTSKRSDPFSALQLGMYSLGLVACLTLGLSLSPAVASEERPVAHASVQSDDERARALIVKYVATWEVASLFQEPAIRAALAHLSDETREHLLRNLSVVGSIDVVSGHLSLSGNAPHQGTEEEAVLCMNAYGQQVDMAIFSQGTVRIFSIQKRYEWLPLCIKDWITGVNNAHQDRMRMPANVVLEALSR